MGSSSMEFILLAWAAAKEEGENILDALTHIEPSLFVMNFLQLVLQVRRHRTTSGPMTCVSTSTRTLSDCLWGIGETEVVLIVPRLVKFVHGDPSADGNDHSNNQVGYWDQGDPGQNQRDSQVPVFVHLEHSVPVEFEDSKNKIAASGLYPTSLSRREKD